MQLPILALAGFIVGFSQIFPLFAEEQDKRLTESPEQVFGSEKSDKPIAAGWVFLSDGYLMPPYQIVRKGLIIYINGSSAEVTGVWPPFVPIKVNEDPGAPPPGLDPLGPTPTGQPDYWGLKQRFLLTHFSPLDAQLKYVEALRTSGYFSIIAPDEADQSIIRVIDKQGEKSSILLLPETPTGPVTEDEIEAMKEHAISEFKKCSSALTLGLAIWQVRQNGYLGVLNAEKTKQILSEITSGKSELEIAGAITQIFGKPASSGKDFMPSLLGLMKAGHDLGLLTRLRFQAENEARP